jgi:N-glycosylase/DNA lyase
MTPKGEMVAKIDQYLEALSEDERLYTEKEMKKMLRILAHIIGSDRDVDPVIHEMTPTFKKIVPLAYACFEELGWRI